MTPNDCALRNDLTSKNGIASRNDIPSRALRSLILLLTLALAGGALSQENPPPAWNVLKTNSQAEFTGAIIFSLATTLFVDDAGRLWDTWDTSLVLTPYELDIIDSRRQPIKGVRFTGISYNTDSTGFICGERGVLLQTDNWGRNWKQRYFENLDLLYFYGIEFANRRQGVLCGVTGDEKIRVKGIIYITSDGGDTWREIKDIPGTGFSSLSYDRAGKRFIITAIGAVLISEDNGETWQYVRVPEGQLMRSSLLDEEHGISVGMKGRTLITNDTGQTWIEVESPSKNNLLAVSRFNPGHWYVAGAGGEVWVTVDYGANWKNLGAPRDVTLYGIKRKGPRLFVWGSDGTIMTLRMGNR